MKTKLKSALVVGLGLLFALVIGQEMYRVGGVRRVIFIVVIPGIIGIVLAVLFPHRWNSTD